MPGELTKADRKALAAIGDGFTAARWGDKFFGAPRGVTPFRAHRLACAGMVKQRHVDWARSRYEPTEAGRAALAREPDDGR